LSSQMIRYGEALVVRSSGGEGSLLVSRVGSPP
jgi:hypothetical protein